MLQKRTARLLTISILLVSVGSAVVSNGQECATLNEASIKDADKYIQTLDHSKVSADCIAAAFNVIAAAPAQQAVPVLIKYLDYKRPLNEGERNGIFMHGNGPEVLYPAVDALFHVGDVAEPAIIRLIAERTLARVRLRNALYTLVLIHHGDTVSVIQELSRARTGSNSLSERQRLQSAAHEAVQWCDERWKDKCEDALKE
jgi:hypothetical protein